MMPIRLLLCALMVVSSAFAVDPICQPFTTDVLSPNQLPLLPNLFQTRIEATFMESNRTVDMFIAYDNVDKLAELVEFRDGVSVRRYFRYVTNEVITLRGNRCEASKITDMKDNWFFSVAITPTGLNMQPPNMVLHFNNGFPHIKVEQTTRRSIPVNHFRSCQSWPELAAVFQIDYYIRVPSFEPGIVYDPAFKEVPILAEIEGHIQMNTSQPLYFKHQYSFFDFHPHIERNPLLYSIPEGVYCKDQMLFPSMPKVPPSFSFVEESVYPELRFGVTTRLHYSSELKATRVDLANAPQLTNIDVNNPVNIIHDFNNGVGYVIDDVRGDCTLYSIGNSPVDIDATSFVSSAGSLLRLKEPNEIFYLDDTYVYAGQRVRRGIVCDVYASKRTDIKLPPAFNATPEYILFETYIMNTRVQIDESSDLREQFVIIAIDASAPDFPLTIKNEFYNFDSKPLTERNFDLSKCFKEKDKIQFAVRYSYPLGLDKENFEKFFKGQIQAKFRETILNSFKIFHASPLRLLPTSVETFNETFVIFSALTSYPEPIKQFQFKQKIKINVPGGKYVVKALNPEECAFICLNESVFDVFNYKCMSFDFCASPVGGVCSFYNASVVTDPSIVVQGEGSECDHYSKIVMNSDGASVQTLYRSVEESVARKQFDVEFLTPDSGLVVNFRARDVYTVHFDRTSDQNAQGFTSFFKQFIAYSKDIDFNVDEIKKNVTIFLRTKSGISVDECARLCLREPAFDCQSMSYDYPSQDCKWSSLVAAYEPDDLTKIPYLTARNGHSFFLRDLLFNYYEFPYQVATITDYKVVEVQSKQICAYYCDVEADFKCRSFNFCKQPDGGPSLCLLSMSNVHNTQQDPNIQSAPSCSHYSKKGSTDFEMIPQSQLALKSGGLLAPMSTLANTSVEICSEFCLFTDAFVCRSFDFLLDSNICNLFSQNVVDKFEQVAFTLAKNNNSNHYSRLYFFENGVRVDVVPKAGSSKAKYSGGSITGVVFALIIAGFLIGVLLAFAYMKIKHKESMLPVMRYTNPNFAEPSDN